MPKTLFYAGIVCCVFLAVSSAAVLTQEMEGSPVSFIALHGRTLIAGSSAAWAIVVALLAAVAVASILLRMAALLAARNLFGAFLALFAVSAAVVSLAWVVMLQLRMIALVRHHSAISDGTSEMHLAAVMMLGYFVTLSFLALRPYFRIQASRFLSALCFSRFRCSCSSSFRSCLSPRRPRRCRRPLRRRSSSSLSWQCSSSPSPFTACATVISSSR
jgi:hypothetical protein